MLLSPIPDSIPDLDLYAIFIQTTIDSIYIHPQATLFYNLQIFHKLYIMDQLSADQTNANDVRSAASVVNVNENEQNTSVINQWNHDTDKLFKPDIFFLDNNIDMDFFSIFSSEVL